MLEPKLATTATVGRAGGIARATASDGTVYELTIPPAAVEHDTAITMTPVVSLKGAPFDGTVKAVQFAPEGLVLKEAATLRITLPRAVSKKMVGLVYRGAGRGVTMRKAQRDGRTITTTVEHFSGGGAMDATLANFLLVLARLAALPQFMVDDADDFFATKPAADAVLGRGWCLTDSTCRYTRQRALDTYERDVTRVCRGQLASTIPPLADAARTLARIEATTQSEGENVPTRTCRRTITEHMVRLVEQPARQDALAVSGACADAIGDADGDGETRNTECALTVSASAGSQGFADLQANAADAATAGLRQVIAGNQPKCDSPGTFDEGLRQLRLGGATAAPFALLTAEFDAALEECVRITVTPAPASVEIGQTLDFSAKGKDPTDQSFSWSVSGAGAKIDQNGHLTAPAKPGTVIVTASSNTHPDREGAVSVAITCPPGKVADGNECKVVTIEISPATIGLQRGDVQRFTATVTGTPDTRVTWSATGGSVTQPGGSDAGGLYTAGQTDGSFTVTASSLQFPTLHATAQVSIGSGTVAVTLRNGSLFSSSGAFAQSNEPPGLSATMVDVKPPPPGSDTWTGPLLGTKSGSFTTSSTAELPASTPTVTASSSASVSSTSTVSVDGSGQLHTALSLTGTQDAAADQDLTDGGYVQGAKGDTANFATDAVQFTVAGGELSITCSLTKASLPTFEPNHIGGSDGTSVRVQQGSSGTTLLLLDSSTGTSGSTTLAAGTYKVDMHAGVNVFALNGWNASFATLDAKTVHYSGSVGATCSTSG
ncbi:MAG: Ig-like domain-containing protein [Baekduia sp.]